MTAITATLSAPDEALEDIASAIAPADGKMSAAELGKILMDVREQPDWRYEADTDAAYREGAQFTAEQIRALEDFKVSTQPTNLIAPVINLLAGMEAKSRTDWRVSSGNLARPLPEPLNQALNAELKDAQVKSGADEAISEAYDSQIVAGIGWTETGHELDAVKYPHRVAHVHRDEIAWDWRAKHPMLDDGTFVVRSRWVDGAVLPQMFPGDQEWLREVAKGGFSTWQWSMISEVSQTRLQQAQRDELTWGSMQEVEWRDIYRGRVCLWEVWYRRWVRGFVMRSSPHARAIPFDETNEAHVAAVAAGRVSVQPALYTRVRVAHYVGPHQIGDYPSPYSHGFFPYTPFWGFRTDKLRQPYGVVRAMRGPQDDVNEHDKRLAIDSKVKRVIAESDALDTSFNTWQDVAAEINLPNSQILLNPQRRGARFEIVSGAQTDPNRMNLRMQRSTDIENAAGVYKAMLGKQGGSGIAINSLVEQGNTGQAKINDNYRAARQRIGLMLFSNLLDDLREARDVPIGFKKDGKVQVVVCNQTQPDGSIGNDLRQVHADVSLEQIPTTASYRMQQLQMMVELTRSLPPQVQAATIRYVIELTDHPQREAIIADLERAGFIQPAGDDQQVQAAQAMQQQLAQQAAKLEADDKAAAIRERLAKVEKLLAETEAIRAEMGQGAMPMQPTPAAQPEMMPAEPAVPMEAPPVTWQ
jgi:hypothetical protein